MTQSEIYDRIIADIILEWHHDEHANMDKTVEKIRSLSKHWIHDLGAGFGRYLHNNYPQYYKELET